MCSVLQIIHRIVNSSKSLHHHIPEAGCTSTVRTHGWLLITIAEMEMLMACISVISYLQTDYQNLVLPKLFRLGHSSDLVVVLLVGISSACQRMTINSNPASTSSIRHHSQ